LLKNSNLESPKKPIGIIEHDLGQGLALMLSKI